MEILKKHFFTITASAAAILIAMAAVLQSNLAYLYQLDQAERIIHVIDKVDQISFLLVIGLMLTIIVSVLGFHKPRRCKSILVFFLTLFILTLLAKGKFENMGTDSMAELIHTNAQEASDFTRSYLLSANVSVKEAIVLFAPLLLIPVYVFSLRGEHGTAQLADVRRALKIIAVIYLATIVTFLYQLSTNYHPIHHFKHRLDDSTAQTLHALEKKRDGPNVVVYIGESTSRENLPIYNRRSVLPDSLQEIKNDLILYTDVITSFSHTFPSLYRAFSLSRDPYQDQFLLVKDVHRANSIALLKHFGIETYWISNQNLAGHWDWNSELFGKHASHTKILNNSPRSYFNQIRKTDKVLIDAYQQHAGNLNQRHQMMFLHSYAGHGDYCKNIPLEERQATGQTAPRLSQKAMFGNVYIGDIDQRMKDIGCYDSVMSYISKNLRKVIDDIAQRPTPIVFLYFSDHGEEVFEGTGHDSRKNSFRHIEIPFLIYFNAAAKQAYPDLYRAALANKDKPYSTEWLADTLLDLAGVASRERSLLSVFSEGLHVPKRYALRRTDIRGNQFILAVDDEDASRSYALLNQGHDYYRKRRIYNAFPPDEKNKICSYRTNSLLKYREAAQIFNCIEVDITIDADSGNLYAYRPPQDNNFLKLEDLIRFGPVISGQLLLSVSNPQEKNLGLLHDQLNRLFEPARRDRVVIEIAHFDGVDKTQLRRLASAGYKLFYALPAEFGIGCAKRPKQIECRRFGEEILPVMEQAGVQGIAFDIEAAPFVTSLHTSHKLAYNIKDLSVKSEADINSAMLGKSHFYSIPYDSAFDY